MVRLSLVDLRSLEEAEVRQTELEAQLAQAQRLEAVGKLTGGVAHDLNNQLTVMKGSLELLGSNTDLRAPDRDLVQDALAAVSRSGRLIRKMLAFARRQALEPRPIHLHALLGEMGPLLAPTLGEGIRLSLDVPGDLPTFEADPAQLETALLNLAINAREAMPDGGLLRITARERHMGPGEHKGPGELAVGRYVVISVVDTGHGMDAETARHAVDPFFTTKAVGSGSGLGLSMVFGFAVQSGGGLGIESRPGAGTTMTLYFPRAPEQGLPG
jgi:signal transduction histidine kinase